MDLPAGEGFKHLLPPERKWASTVLNYQIERLRRETSDSDEVNLRSASRLALVSCACLWGLGGGLVALIGVGVVRFDEPLGYACFAATVAPFATALLRLHQSRRYRPEPPA